MRRWIAPIALVAIFSVGCSSTQPIDNMYSQNVLPGNTGVSYVGKAVHPYTEGYFANINGIPSSDYVINSYGQLWEDANVTPSNYTLVTPGQFYQWTTGTAGDSKYTIISPATGIVVKQSGEYLVTAYQSCQSSKTNAVIHWAVFVNGVEQNNVEAEHMHPNANSVMASAESGLIHLVAGSTVDLRFSSDTANTVLGVNHASLTVNRVGN